MTTMSACVDCATPIVGERQRCPTCHQLHATLLIARPLHDEDVLTTRRPREGRNGSLHMLAWGVVVIELISIAVFGLILAMRGCVS